MSETVEDTEEDPVVEIDIVSVDVAVCEGMTGGSRDEDLVVVPVRDAVCGLDDENVEDGDRDDVADSERVEDDDLVSVPVALKPDADAE